MIGALAFAHPDAGTTTAIVVGILGFFGALTPLYIAVFNRPTERRKVDLTERTTEGQLQDTLLDNARETIVMANKQADRERERADRAEAKASALESRVEQLEQTIREQAEHITLIERENRGFTERIARLEARLSVAESQ
jgi:chromosome segregation ATPase